MRDEGFIAPTARPSTAAVGEGVRLMPFELDTDKAIEAIAEVFHIDPEDTEEWRLDRFGADLGDFIAALADIVFAPRRDALTCPEELIIDVHAILDLHSFPCRRLPLGAGRGLRLPG